MLGKQGVEVFCLREGEGEREKGVRGGRRKEKEKGKKMETVEPQSDQQWGGWSRMVGVRLDGLLLTALRDLSPPPSVQWGSGRTVPPSRLVGKSKRDGIKNLTVSGASYGLSTKQLLLFR